MPGKTKLSSYCLLRDDHRLHTLIKHRMNQKKATLKELADFIGTDESAVRKFLKHGSHSISQQKVLSISAYLGISIGLNIEVVE